MFRSLICLAVFSILAPSLRADSIYVSQLKAELLKGSILEIDSLGNVSTYRSGMNPVGLVFNSAGDLYISDAYPARILKYPAAGGSSFFTNRVLQSPNEIKFDTNGDLWVADAGLPGGNGSVRRILRDGTISTVGLIPGSLGGIAIDADGAIFTASYYSGEIYKLVPNDVGDATITKFATAVPTPGSLAFDDAGNLYASGSRDGVISKISPAGLVSEFATGITGVRGIAFGSDGVLYASSRMNGGSIVKILPDGAVAPFVANLGTVGFLTVVVPEPSAIVLSSLGLVAAIGIASRRPRLRG